MYENATGSLLESHMIRKDNKQETLELVANYGVG